MSKKIISAILTVALLCAIAIPAFAAPVDSFNDVKASDWFYNAVKFATEEGMVNGTSTVTFSPYSTMTRAQFVTILGRMDGIKDGDTQPSSGYTDVADDQYFTAHINWAAANGISDVKGDKFRPYDNIIREEMAIIVGKYVEYKNVTLADDPSAPAAYNDAASISAAARPYVEILRKCGLLLGNDLGNLNPQKNMNRAEGVTVFMRICEKFEAANPANWFQTAQRSYTISVDDKNIGIYDYITASAKSTITTNGYTLSLSSISDRSVLTTKDNNFEPLKAGTVTVTWACDTGSAGVIYATATVTVRASDIVYPTGMTALVTNFSLNIGDTAQIQIEFTPSNTTVKDLTFTSLNSSIAQVSSTGRITAAGSGSTQIQVAGPANLTLTLNVNVASRQTVSLNGIAISDTLADVNALLGEPKESYEYDNGMMTMKVYHDGSYNSFVLVCYQIDSVAYVYVMGRSNTVEGTIPAVTTTQYLDQGSGNQPYATAIKSSAFPNRIINEESAEQLIFHITNAFRVLNGASVLAWSDPLGVAAHNHTQDMADHDNLTHVGSDGSSFSQRAYAAGYTGFPAGENCAWGYPTPVDCVNGWIQSTQGHRENILNPNHRDIGVGFVGAYATQVFGQ